MANASPNFSNLFSSGGLHVGTVRHLCGSRYRMGPAVLELPQKDLFFPSPIAIRWRV